MGLFSELLLVAKISDYSPAFIVSPVLQELQIVYSFQVSACLKAAISRRCRIFQQYHGVRKGSGESKAFQSKVRYDFPSDILNVDFWISISWRYAYMSRLLNLQGKGHGSPSNNRDGRQENDYYKHQGRHVNSQMFFCYSRRML